jgi:hypothetical protein
MSDLSIPELKEIISTLERYKDFTILDNPVIFSDLFVNKNIDVVQLHSTQIINMDDHKDIVGFCGQCEWKNNQIKSLDGDSYSDNMKVYGYEWFSNEEEGIRVGVDILVGEDW